MNIDSGGERSFYLKKEYDIMSKAVISHDLVTL